MKIISNASSSEATQLKDSFVGPRVPTIGFWYRNKFLGEARYIQKSDPAAAIYQGLTWLAQAFRKCGMYNELNKLYSTERTYRIVY